MGKTAIIPDHKPKNCLVLTYSGTFLKFSSILAGLILTTCILSLGRVRFPVVIG